MKKKIFIGISAIVIIILGFLGFYLFNSNVVYSISILGGETFESQLGGYNTVPVDVDIKCKGYMSESSINKSIAIDRENKKSMIKTMDSLAAKNKYDNVIQVAMNSAKNETKILVVTSRWTWCKIKNKPIEVIKHPERYTNIKIYPVY